MNRSAQSLVVALVMCFAAVAAIVASVRSGRMGLEPIVAPWEQEASTSETPGQDPPGAAFNRRGNAAEVAGDDATAIREFAGGETADPNYVWNYVGLGAVYARLGRLTSADRQFRQAVGLAPATQFLHFDLATVELREARYQAALNDFEAETRISPNYKPAIDGKRMALDALHGRAVRLAAILPTPIAAAPTATPAASPTPAPSVRAILAHKTRLAARTSPSPALPAPAPTQAIGISVAVPTQTPTVSTGTAAQARAYLLEVSQDLNFTQALPPADPSATTTQLRERLQAATRSPRASEDELLRIGASALVSGRLSLAAVAFAVAAQRAPDDWRALYLAGLAARADGDIESALGFFNKANARTARPETYTSLAVADLALGNDDAATTDADQAASLDPSYGPGRFTAGMVALARGDAAQAQRHLAAASSLTGVPAGLDRFLASVSPR